MYKRQVVDVFSPLSAFVLPPVGGVLERFRDGLFISGVEALGIGNCSLVTVLSGDGGMISSSSDSACKNKLGSKLGLSKAYL